jgi:hypothetical protein
VPVPCSHKHRGSILKADSRSHRTQFIAVLRVPPLRKAPFNLRRYRGRSLAQI